MSDNHDDARAICALSLVDIVSLFSPFSEAGSQLTCEQICKFLYPVIIAHGFTKSVRLVNGSEVNGAALFARPYCRGVKLCFFRPAKPTDYAFCKSFTAKIRDEFLATH